MSERTRRFLALTLVALLGGAWFWLRSPEPNQPTELDAAVAALEAWGRWAGDGDLSHLEETFAEGPQLAQIRNEDESIVPGAAYKFVLTEAEIVGPGLVRGQVLLSRPGEVEQRYRWDLEFVEVDGFWRLWTVRTSS